MSRKSKKQLEKNLKSRQDQISERLDGTVDSVVGAAKNAREWASPQIERGVALGRAYAGPQIERGVSYAAPRLEKGIAYATPKIQDALDRVGPQLDAAGHRLTEDYLPRLSDKVGDVASSAGDALAGLSVPAGVDKAAGKITGKKGSASKAVNRASKQLQSQKRSKGKGALICLTVIAGVAAAAAVLWKKSKPADDPWATPINSRPGDARPVGTPSRVAQEAAEKAKHVAGNVGDKVGQAGEAAKSAVSDATAKVKDAADSAADKAQETANKTKSTADVAAAKATDAAGTAAAKTSSAADNAADKAADAADKTKNAADDAAGKAHDATDKATDKTQGATTQAADKAAAQAGGAHAAPVDPKAKEDAAKAAARIDEAARKAKEQGGK